MKVGRISEAGISLDDPRPVSPPSEFPRRMDDEEMRALAKLLRARVADSRGVQLWGDLALIVADTLDAARAAPQADAGTLREAAITTVCDLLWANGVYMKDSQPLATAIVDVLCGAALGAPSHATAGRDDG